MKATEKAFRKCFTNRCSVKLNKIHRNVPVWESHLNTVAGFQPATLLKRNSGTRVFLS